MKLIVYSKINGDEPLTDYINSLNKKFKSKVLWDIGLLEKYGLDLKEPYVKRISGKKYNKLFELRIKFSSDISRVFYFSYTNGDLILLNGYTKKKNKTDTRELDIALKYMKDYEVRYGKE